MSKILLIDDDNLAGEMTSAVLEMHGHQVILCENAIEALEQVAMHDDLTLIISDMHMPMISGVELFQTLQEQNNKLPFILLTGDDAETYMKQEPRLSACLTKDASLDERLPALVSQLTMQPTEGKE